MKIKYEYVTDEVVEIDVDEKWASVLMDMELEDEVIERKETRRHVPLDTSYGWSDWLIEDDDPEEAIIEMIDSGNDFDLAMSVLNIKQKALLHGLFVEGLTQREYAERMGVDQSAISYQLQTIRKKLKKLF